MPDDRPRLDTPHPLAQPLAAAAQAPDEERFTTLVEAVLHEPDATAVALLAPWLGQGGGIGRLAAHGLLMLGAPALAPLLAALEAPEPAARVNAAWALGGMADPAATAALLEQLEAPEAPEALVKACLSSLAELADRRAATRLRGLLARPDFAPHHPALLKALGNIGDRQAIGDVAPFLRSESPELRLRAAEALVRLLDKRGYPVLYELLRGDDPKGDSMIAALRDLGDLSSSLTAFVGDDQYQWRREAAEVLGTFGEPQAVPALIDALRDINPWVRGAAAYSLGRLGDRRAFRPLVAATADSSIWVRQCAVRALGLLGDRRALRALEAFIFDRDPEVAAAAQEALGLLAE